MQSMQGQDARALSSVGPHGPEDGWPPTLVPDRHPKARTRVRMPSAGSGICSLRWEVRSRVSRRKGQVVERVRFAGAPAGPGPMAGPARRRAASSGLMPLIAFCAASASAQEATGIGRANG
jgi:hypothetical protein